MGKTTSQAMPSRLKVWLIASMVMLVGSLMLFVANVAAGFVYFTAEIAPLWVTVIGVVAVVGMGLGIAGLFVVFLLTALSTRREVAARAPGQE